MSREIPLTQGKVAIVDDEDYERVSQFKWHAWRSNGGWYAKRQFGRMRQGPGKPRLTGKVLCMSQFILGNASTVDHKNGNPLDNRRENLRFATRYQSSANRRGFKNSTGHQNIHYRNTGKFGVHIGANGRHYTKDGFSTVDDAIEFRDLLAIELHGEFAAHLRSAP